MRKRHITDHELMIAYWVGWYDCPDNNSRGISFLDKRLRIAYNMGWVDYMVGDEIKSSDLQTEEAILSRINSRLQYALPTV